jgi:tetratricopeptide (TPR) repeat protein
MYETLLAECDHPGGRSPVPLPLDGIPQPVPTAGLAKEPAPDVAVSPEFLSQNLHERGLEAFRQGKWSEAVIWFEHAIQKRETSMLWNDWATAQFQFGRIKAAERGFRKALELDAANAIAAKNLALFLQGAARRAELVAQDCEALRRQRNAIRARAPLARRTGRNLVMGLAAGYCRAQVEPFVCSLRRSGYAGDIVLFVTKPDEDLKALFRQYRVTCEPWKGVSPPFDMMLGRFFHYYEFLAQLDAAGQSYDFVLISDVRDVFFQRDPFLPEPQGEVLAFLEDKSQTLGTCPYNSAWIRAVAGDSELAKLANERIACAGTTLGSWTGIIEYLIVMRIFALEYSVARDLVQGVDQGMHNLLVRRNLLRDCRTVENGERVFTLHYVPKDELHITSRNEVACNNGQLPAVIHQYDRHPQLRELVGRLYASA